MEREPKGGRRCEDKKARSGEEEPKKVSARSGEHLRERRDNDGLLAS